MSTDPARAQSWMYPFHLPMDYCCAHLTLWLGRSSEIQLVMDSSGGMINWHLIAKCSVFTRAIFQMLFLKSHTILCCRWHGFPPESQGPELRFLPCSCHKLCMRSFPTRDTSNTIRSSDRMAKVSGLLELLLGLAAEPLPAPGPTQSWLSQ